eukprot:jgi/Bigna1/90279/estExt_fgenesh1_pg.C_660093
MENDTASKENESEVLAKGAGANTANKKKKKKKNDVVLYVGNLEESVTDRHLHKLFSHCGYILNITIHETEGAQRFAHVTIKKNRKASSKEDTSELALALDGTEVEGKAIKVSSDLSLWIYRRTARKEEEEEKEKDRHDSKQPASMTKNKLEDALKYLDLWESDRKNWKFRKNSQNYLLANCYDRSKIKKTHFKIFLKYIVALSGISGERTRKGRSFSLDFPPTLPSCTLTTEAEDIVRDFDEKVDTTEKEKTDKKAAKLKYNRAVKILEDNYASFLLSFIARASTMVNVSSGP